MDPLGRAIRKPKEWMVAHEPAANTAATITRAAATGAQHFVTSITASISGDVAASAIVHARLRDSTTGAGNILWSAVLRGTITSGNQVALSDINIEIPVGNACTLEFDAAGGAGSVEAVAMGGYTQQRI